MVISPFHSTARFGMAQPGDMRPCGARSMCAVMNIAVLTPPPSGGEIQEKEDRYEKIG